MISAPAPTTAWPACAAPSGVPWSSTIINVTSFMPDSSTASWAASAIETPTLLGWPFWVSGRTRPTRTGPVPTVWPTVGPASGCD